MASLHPLLNGRDPGSGLRPRYLPRLALPSALQRKGSRPAFRWCLLGSSSSFPNTGASTAGLTTRTLTCPFAAPQIARPGTLSLSTLRARTWPGKTKPAEPASVSPLLRPFKDKAPKTASTPALPQLSLQGAAKNGPRFRAHREPSKLPVRDGGQSRGRKTRGRRLRLGFGSSEQARAPPGWGEAG